MNRSRLSIWGIKLVALALGANMLACGHEDRYSEPLPTGAEEAKALLEQYEAEPVRVAGLDAAFVSTKSENPLDCDRCHLVEGKPVRPNQMTPGRKAHWNINIQHAPKMDCVDCHNAQVPTIAEGASAEGEPITHAYLICGNCHMEQLKDWKGGAHGKRLNGWHGPRIMADCVHCHNPHAPAMGKERPVAPPRLIPDRLQRGH